MPARAFVIRELMPGSDDGTVTARESSGRGGARFEWTVENGCMPRGEMALPSLAQKTKRTHYPGNEGQPTEQVLGWEFEDGWEIEGQWDSRRLGAGAPDTMKRAIEELIQRGNRCVFELDNQRYVGRPVKLVPRMHPYGFLYTLTISPHGEGITRRANAGGLRARTRIRTPDEHFADVSEVVTDAETRQEDVPAWSFGGTYHAEVGTALADVTETMTQIRNTLSAREDSRTTTMDVVRSVSSLFALTSTQAATCSLVLSDVDSDDATAWDNPVAVLAFESWARGVASAMRETQLRARDAAVSLGLRVDPATLAIYKPSRGESLHAVARRFYGNGLLWKPISTRNQLEYMNLQGTETLVIPALGGAE